MRCAYCQSDCIRKGNRNNIQRYQCKMCKKYRQENYTKHRIAEEKYEWVSIIELYWDDFSNIVIDKEAFLQDNNSNITLIVPAGTKNKRKGVPKAVKKRGGFFGSTERKKN